MKLTCTRENLFRGLAITSHISTKNVNLPILNNVLLRADEGGLKLISTNLEIAITCHVRGKVEQKGEYTVPSKLIFDYVSLLPNEQVDIDLVDNALSVKCKRTKTKINGITASEFPLVPPVSGSEKYSVSVNEFKNALSSTLFATATNESRPELSGVYLAFHHPSAGKNKLVVAATDSYRLAEMVGNISSGNGESREVIVPQRTLGELSRILSIFKDDVEASPNVDIELSDNQIVFTYGPVELTSRTIEGSYPDYRQIIPTQAKTAAVFDRNAFSQAVKTASLFSKSGLFDITIALKPKDGSLEFFTSDSTRGENLVTVAAEISGLENSITLNSRYLLDGLNALSSGKATLKVIDGANPCILSPENLPGESYQYIIMPIRQ